MPALGPAPQRPKDGIINLGESLFTADVAMIVRPPPNEGIELADQITCGGLFVGFDEMANFSQKGLDALG